MQRSVLFKGLASLGISEVVIHPPIFTEGIKRDGTDVLQDKLHAIINQPLKEKYGV